MSEAFKRNANWKEALTNPLPWLEELGQCGISSKTWQYVQELTELRARKLKKMAETVSLDVPPAPGSEDPAPKAPGSEDPASEDSQDHEQESQSQDDLLKQKQEEDCNAMVKQHMAETIRFVEVNNHLTCSDVGQMLCGNSTVNDFVGNYKSEFKRVFMFDCVALPEARSRPWRSVPKQTQETKERLTGVVTYMKAGDVLFFFDGGLKDNSYMCHEVAQIAVRQGKRLVVTDFSLVFDVEQSSAWSRRRGVGCAQNVETLLV